MRKTRIYLAEKDADRADARDAALFAEGTRRGHSSGTRVDVLQSEKGDAVLWTRLSHLRLMQLDLKDFRRSLTVKSSLTIERQVFADDWETGSSVISRSSCPRVSFPLDLGVNAL